MRSIISMFSINSLTGFSIITCNIWLGYRATYYPQFTKDSDISGSIQIRMEGKSTLDTMERIAFPVSSIDMPAFRTLLAGIARVNQHNGFTKAGYASSPYSKYGASATPAPHGGHNEKTKTYPTNLIW